MTKHQLDKLFDHFRLPKSYGENELSELKKLLLLELKSSASQTILIGNDTWTKNDVVQFFDTPLTEGFHAEAFYEKYPWAELITTPDKITNTRFLDVRAFEDPLFDQFRREVAVHFENPFLKLMKELMSARKDTLNSTLFQYLPCFPFEFQNQVLTTMRSMMNTRLNTTIALMEDETFRDRENEFAYLKRHGYYTFLAQIGDSDKELLILNLEVFSASLKHLNVQTIKSIIKQQRTLPLPPHGILFLDQVQAQVDKVLKQRRATVSQSEGAGSGKVIGYFFSAVIGLILAFSRCNRSNNNNLSMREMQRFEEQFERMRQYQNPVQVDNLGDSIRIIQNNETLYTDQKGLFRPASDSSSSY